MKTTQEYADMLEQEVERIIDIAESQKRLATRPLDFYRAGQHHIAAMNVLQQLMHMTSKDTPPVSTTRQ